MYRLVRRVASIALIGAVVIGKFGSPALAADSREPGLPSAVVPLEAGEAQLATPSDQSSTIDSFIDVQTILVDPSSGEIVVTYELKREVPSQVNLSLSWKYPTSWRNDLEHEAHQIVGAEGDFGRVVFDDLSTAPAVVRVAFEMPIPVGENKSYYILHGPSTTTKLTKVTSADVYGEAIVVALPGLALNFAPVGRFAKVVGLLFSGWGIVADAEEWSMRGAGSPCPPLQAGQWYQTTSTYTAVGEQVRVTLRTVGIAAKDLEAFFTQPSLVTPLCDTTVSFEYA